MKFDFDGDEMSVVLVSLIGRRNNLIKLNEISKGAGTYVQEIEIVDSIIEKMFPGGAKALQAA